MFKDSKYIEWKTHRDDLLFCRISLLFPHCPQQNDVIPGPNHCWWLSGQIHALHSLYWQPM